MIRKIALYTVVVITVGLMAGCRSEEKKLASQITRLEQEIYDTLGRVRPGKIDTLIKAYVDYSRKFPADSLSPIFLMKAGSLAMNTHKPLQAIQYFQQILQDYPHFRKAPEVLFLMGFTYENYLGDLEKAREIYERFLELYPDDDFADDAEMSLKFLGVPPEELIEMLQGQQLMEVN